MTYFYDEDAEDQVTDRLHPWKDRLPLGKHIKSKDKEKPKLPKGYSFNCPEGCGECKVKAFQFYTYASWNYKTMQFNEGQYNKIYAAACHPESLNEVGVWNDVTDEDMGELHDFLSKIKLVKEIKERDED